MCKILEWIRNGLIWIFCVVFGIPLCVIVALSIFLIFIFLIIIGLIGAMVLNVVNIFKRE